MKLNVKRHNKIIICLWHMLYCGLANTLPSGVQSRSLVGFVLRNTLFLRSVLLIIVLLYFCPFSIGYCVVCSSIYGILEFIPCLSSCPFSISHCAVCPSMYGLWLFMWRLLTFRRTFSMTYDFSLSQFPSIFY